VKTITPKAPAPRIEAEVIRPLVSSKEVACAMGCHKRTVEMHAQNGRIPHYRLGGNLRFDLQEVLAAARREVAR